MGDEKGVELGGTLHVGHVTAVGDDDLATVGEKWEHGVLGRFALLLAREDEGWDCGAIGFERIPCFVAIVDASFAMEEKVGVPFVDLLGEGWTDGFGLGTA